HSPAPLRPLASGFTLITQMLMRTLLLGGLTAVVTSIGCAIAPPTTTIPVESLIVIPEERLGIDDVFEARVFSEGELSGVYRISADGTVDYPLIGRLKLVGLTSGEAQELI